MISLNLFMLFSYSVFHNVISITYINNALSYATTRRMKIEIINYKKWEKIFRIDFKRLLLRRSFVKTFRDVLTISSSMNRIEMY